MTKEEFLNQPLEIGMFVPCDEYGDILEEVLEDEKLCKYCDIPSEDRKMTAYSTGCEGSRCEITTRDYTDFYNEAKERVIFEGFEISIGSFATVVSYAATDIYGESITPMIKPNKGEWQTTKGVKTVRDLVEWNLPLTESAKSKIK